MSKQKPQKPVDKSPEKPRDLDIEVVRLLDRLTDGRGGLFADQQPPPETVAAFLAGADIRQTRGVLCAALRRWSQLGESSPPLSG